MELLPAALLQPRRDPARAGAGTAGRTARRPVATALGAAAVVAAPSRRVVVEVVVAEVEQEEERREWVVGGELAVL